ncbi:MAG: bactofilin family protein [Hyphomicrobium sp.]
MFSSRPTTAAPLSATEADKVQTAPATTAAKPHSPVQAYAQHGEANYSIINEWLTMRGDLVSEGDILVKGKVLGNIHCKFLIVDAGAYIDGGILADDVVIRGETKGIIKAKRVRIERTATVNSEIFHETFSAEEGARVRGALRYSDETETASAATLGAPAGVDKKISSQLYDLLDAARTPATPAH